MTRRTRKMKNNKYLCERVHFKNRLLQRYGIECNRVLYRDLISTVNRNTFLLQQSLTKEVHEIDVNDTLVWVVFDTSRGEFITALEYECELRLETGDDDETKQKFISAAYRRHREILADKIGYCRIERACDFC